MRLSKLVPFVLCLIAFLPRLNAQQKLSVKLFHSVPEDMTARVTAPVTDLNGDKCALIKVRTTQKGFVFDGGMLGITKTKQEVGEIWVYVPAKAKKITIKHPQLGVLDSYVYPESIKESTVYIMELICGKVTTIVENADIPSQYVVINSIPQGAEVYIDDVFVGNTPITNKKFEIGKHTYRIENPLFHNQAGLFELKLNKKYVLETELKPNYGWAKIETSPESGAEVLVDGVRLKEKTPLKTDKLQSGEHTIIVRKELYKDITRKIIISDNEITDLKIDLDANFGNVKLTSTPIVGAEVILDGIPTGKETPCSFEKLPSGDHTIKLRAKWYEPKSVKFSLADNEEKDLKLELNPTFGVVQIKTISGASIYLDNKLMGKEEYKTRLIAGIYTVEARKDKYHSHKKTINVAVGDQQVIELNPKPKYGNLDVVSTPYDADVYINGEHKGKTPQTIRNILEGEYKIEIKKSGYGTVKKNFTIKENTTTTLNEKLPSGKSIIIKSKSSKCNVYIKNKKVGKTPYKTTLAYGTYGVRVAKKGKSEYRNIRISQNSPTVYKYGIDVDKKFFITYNVMSYAPLGIKLGLIRGTGFYIGANMRSGKMTNDYDYEHDGERVLDFNPETPQYYTSTEDKAEVTYYNFTAGLTSQLGKNIFIYYGVGYGSYTKVHNFNIYHYDKSPAGEFKAKDIENSLEGIGGEAGFIIKAGSVIFTAGANALSMKRIDYQFGFGFNF